MFDLDQGSSRTILCRDCSYRLTVRDVSDRLEIFVETLAGTAYQPSACFNFASGTWSRQSQPAPAVVGEEIAMFGWQEWVELVCGNRYKLAISQYSNKGPQILVKTADGRELARCWCDLCCGWKFPT